MIYEARCDNCYGYSTHNRTIADRDNLPHCSTCYGRLVRVIENAPSGFVKGEIQPFKSVVDGSVISTQRELNEHNIRNNVVCLSDGYSEEVIKSGNFGKQRPKDEAKNIKEDMIQSIQKLNDGYKPKLEVQENE